MKTQYAIYKNRFNNDCCYYDITDSTLYQVFDSLEVAKSTIKRLNAHAFRVNDYWVNYERDNLRNLIKEFTFKKLGKPFNTLSKTICKKLSQDDLVELADLLQLELYSLVDVSENKMCWAIWLNYENRYLSKFFDEECFLVEADNHVFIDALNNNPPVGSLENLANSPHILKSLLNTQSTVNYDNNRITIVKSWQEFNSQNLSELKKINAWLKNRWFEFREVGLKSLNELEK